MADEKVIIDLCSSEDEEDFVDVNNCVYIEDTEEEEDEEEDEEEEEEEEEEEDTSSSEDDADWNHDDEDDEPGEKDDDYDKVIRLLTAGSDLKALNVKDCKAYLRKHGLRLSGTKAVFIERIVEHWRIKDGSGEALYPKSSFAINCKGDVCKGDTVLFTQKVHQKYGKIMGRRTVAGQVVKESYGTAKQQHTFTIEVLWCEGIQKLPPLYPLLVKGRNLYRLMTLRQRWANEEDRVKVLSEKHSRGAAARKVMRERKIKLGYVLKDGRLQKPGQVKKPFQIKTGANEKDENQTQRFTQHISANHSLSAFPNQNPSQGHKNPTQLRNITNLPFHSNTYHSYAPPPNVPHPYAPPPNVPHPYAPPPNGPRPYTPFNVPYSHLPPSHSYVHPTQQNQSIQRPPPVFYNGRPTFNAMQGHTSFNPHANTYQSRPYQNHHTNHANYGVRDLDLFTHMLISQRREDMVTRRPNGSHSNSNNGYNHGASHMINHRREGDTHRQSWETHRPYHR